MEEPRFIWRVNRKPRFTVLDMGEYMAADDGPRETMLRDMKYERMARSLTYRIVRDAIASYMVSPIRDRQIFENCRERLNREIENAALPQQRENFVHELRALEAFERSLNALATNQYNIERAPPATPLPIEGVAVSVQPTAHIRLSRRRGASDLVGAIVVDVAKGATPKTDEGKARLTSGMTHGAILVHQYVVTAFAGQEVKISPEHCIIFHSYRQERVNAPDSYKKTLRNVEAVCRNIARGWDNIVPPASFDPNRAKYRN